MQVRPLLLVALTAADGVTGYGEAAPLRSYDGVSIDDVRPALEDCRGVVAQSDGATSERSELLRECRRVSVLPQAVAAIDLALWDLAGRRTGEPVWRLLGAGARPAVEVNATIASPDRAGAAAAASAALAHGFGCVKVKVGLGDDAGRLAAVRAAAGRSMRIRLDANGAWSVEEALAALGALAPSGIELCEEPVSGLERFDALYAARPPVPIALDETSAAPGALEHRVCDAVCLKVSRCGGISGVVDASARARAAGYEVYLASTLDGPLGIAAALHAAAVVKPDRACGLATLPMFEGRRDVLAGSGGFMVAPDGPGLGGELPAWY